MRCDMKKFSLKKLLSILMASFFVKALLYFTILKIDFIPIINNCIVVFIFALLPILDAIIIGYMINEFKRMYLKIIFAEQEVPEKFKDYLKIEDETSREIIESIIKNYE